ncbi:MAG: c-type cytochrome [Candidatus Hydrothermarchaeales archaeon]
MKRLHVVGIVFLILLAGCLGETEQKTEKKTAVVQPTPSIAEGKTVFDSNCRVCHGLDGKGVPGTGAADLTSPRVKALSRERKIDQVTNGGIEMPAYGDALTQEEIEAVVEYIGTL